ncbi:MAG: hypothetical protein IAE86_04565 [Burkholderiaceae bacterium]|nr:hypothetical protein [Burkholderiaceae bacterium]
MRAASAHDGREISGPGCFVDAARELRGRMQVLLLGATHAAWARSNVELAVALTGAEPGWAAAA